MRKLLAVIISVLMILSCAALGVSAEEADVTVIKTAEDFTKIADNLAGNYKLASDLSIAAGLAGSFTGTFDGDGHTITVTESIFATLAGGTVKNLIIKGEVKATGNAGALANSGNEGFKVINVTNYANVSSNYKDAYVGGLIGSVSTGTATAASYPYNEFTDCTNYGTIHGGAGTPRIGGIAGNNAKYAYTTYTNCVNYGNLDVSQDDGATAITGSPYLGGISASTFGGKYVNCLNKGEIKSAIGAHGGGIIGRITPSSQKANQSVDITNCTNEGNVTANGGGIGGIVGYCGASMSANAFGVYTFTKCVNKGTLTQNTSGNLGGICGYIYGQNTKDKTTGAPTTSYQYGVFESCVNLGDCIANSDVANAKYVFSSQIIGYTNTRDTTLHNCISAAKNQNTDAAHAVIVGLSSDDSTLYIMSENLIVENDGTKMYSYAASDDYAANRIAFDARPAGFYTVATAAQAQTAIAALGEIGYIAPVVETPVVDDPVTGDSIVFVAVVAIVAVLGMGIAFKAREN